MVIHETITVLVEQCSQKPFQPNILERNKRTYLCDKLSIAFLLCHTMQYTKVLHPDRPVVSSFPEVDGLVLCPVISIALPVL